MIPQAVQDWLEVNGHAAVVSERPVGGGCINNGMVLTTRSGTTFFLKTNRKAPADMFAREAEGLQELRIDGGLRVPEPLLWNGGFLLLENLSPASRKPDYWVDFGHKLAAQHQRTHDQFGFHHDNYIGSTPQPNPWAGDGYSFFAEQRLLFQARLAQQRGLLGGAEVHQVAQLTARLPDLVPAQPASLLHGDLWSGNALTDAHGNPAIIDPAAHYGWAEAELAMTTLFGSFNSAFYQAYQEVRPLEPGFQDRFDLYNLYHLLNHLNLFGSGYLGSVQQVLKRYR